MHISKVISVIAIVATTNAWSQADLDPAIFDPTKAGSAIPLEKREAVLKELEESVNIGLKKYEEAMTKPDPVLQDIANKGQDTQKQAVLADRAKIMKYLGIEQATGANLYYFVSWEMGLELLRQYALEAMWSGGTLVFRGIPKGLTLAQFIGDYMSKLTYGKDSSVSITIDPKLYDAFQVDMVPAIVYAEDTLLISCGKESQVKLTLSSGKEYSYSRCNHPDSNKYWKISGSITSQWAFEEIASAGGKGVLRHQEALAKGLASGEVVKGQKNFAGEWKDAVTPREKMVIENLIKAAVKAEPSLREKIRSQGFFQDSPNGDIILPAQTWNLEAMKQLTEELEARVTPGEQ